jgi:phosphate transport system protein
MPIELQSELTSLRRDLLTMGAMVERRLTRVIDALVENDLDAAHEVREGDDEIDRMETLIEEHAMRLLALAHRLERAEPPVLINQRQHVAPPRIDRKSVV